MIKELELAIVEEVLLAVFFHNHIFNMNHKFTHFLLKTKFNITNSFDACLLYSHYYRYCTFYNAYINIDFYDKNDHVSCF